MSQPVHQRWNTDEFFAWQERQDARYELVDGFPLKLMAGASNVHDRIVVNLLVELRQRLRAGPCRPFTGDSSVETYPGQIRRPDAGVDCGRFDPQGYRAAEPRLVVEVLSPSTRDFDTYRKLEEYKAVPSMANILLVEPNAPEVAMWSRVEDGTWQASRLEGLESAVELPAIGIVLPMGEIYDGVEFPTTPVRLVMFERD